MSDLCWAEHELYPMHQWPLLARKYLCDLMFDRLQAYNDQRVRLLWLNLWDFSDFQYEYYSDQWTEHGFHYLLRQYYT